MNPGAKPGLNADGWRNYDVTIVGSNGSGNPTQPGLGNSTFLGRYLRLGSGLAFVEIYLKIGSTFSAGNAQNYTLRLPFPANRWTNALSNSTADIPIGYGYVSEGTTDHTTYSSTVAAGSNSVNTNTFLGGQTLNVASTSGATQNGTINVATGGTTALVSYSGITATTFTGCNTLSGGGAMSTGGAVTGVTGVNKVLPIIPTLADPLSPTNLQTNEDYYCHLFIQHSKNSGSGTIANATSSITVTHNLGVTPVASDITITPTGNPTTNPVLLSVQNITTTTFDVVAGQSITTGTVPFYWKAMVEPNSTANFPQLVSGVKPWNFGPDHIIAVQLVYETRF